MMRQAEKTGNIALNSWKEIATYLGRGVRTVQRWERELQLPVHRIGKGKRSPVFANSTELNFWLLTSEAGRDRKVQKYPIPPRKTNGNSFEDSHRLLASVRELAKTIAETSVRQHHQAEILQAQILRMRSRLK
jgi:hypothetical protein